MRLIKICKLIIYVTAVVFFFIGVSALFELDSNQTKGLITAIVAIFVIGLLEY